MQLLPYKLPDPAFGPGSLEYSRKQAKELEALVGEKQDGGIAEETPNRTTYAGAGAYY